MDNSIIENDVKGVLSNVDISEVKNKRILITGATGLIGTYFVYSLIEASKQGIVPKSLSFVHHNPLPSYLKKVEEIDWVYPIQGDLCDNKIFEKMDCYDYIIHLAGYGQPIKYSMDKTKTVKLNTTVTMELLERLAENGKFLFASSCSVYAGAEKDCTEDDIGSINTTHPRACYIEGKKCGETIINTFREKGINAKSARISYTYGPGIKESDRRALYEFIRKGTSGKIELLDDGSAQRIYCYITTCLELLWDILLFGKNPIYNVGGIERISILDVANMVGQYMDAEVILPEISNPLIGSPTNERYSMSRTLKEFPVSFVPFKEGVKKTIDWYRSNYCSSK